MSKRMPLIFVVIMISSVFLAPLIPLELKRFIFTISLLLKSIVVFLLPFIIFGLLFRTFANMANGAAKFIFSVIGCVCTSNFFNVFLTKYAGSFLYKMDLGTIKMVAQQDMLEPYLNLTIPKLITNEFALFGGILAGLIISAVNKDYSQKAAAKAEVATKKLLSFACFLIPLFVIGFVIKCAHDGIFTSVFRAAAIFLLYSSLTLQYTYY